MAHQRHSHCSYCGAKFPEVAVKHAVCGACGNETWLSPVPVAVMILPVLLTDGVGVVLVRRGISPKKGEWCLPGGYVDFGESMEEAASRELREETTVALPPQWQVRVLHTRYTQERLTVAFCAAFPVHEIVLPRPFVPNDEVLEIKVVRAPIELCFSTHTEALQRYFDQLPPR